MISSLYYNARKEFVKGNIHNLIRYGNHEPFRVGAVDVESVSTCMGDIVLCHGQDWDRIDHILIRICPKKEASGQ